ncbi:ATP-binding cassette domain-containing protein [Streptomyces sp. NPDC001982]|uniref:ABC transporter ATP-binding protein n=1 Tax=Streptomyces sp. NPDC001982 TaxID=3154405 RepID=UPI003324971E
MDLSVSFGGKAALSGLSVDICTGESVGVIGPNGAGKSTFLNALCGLSGSATGGSVIFRGTPIDSLPCAQRIRLGLARTFQDPRLIDSQTVLENTLVGAHLRHTYTLIDQIIRPRRVGRNEKQLKSDALATLELVGLSKYAQMPASSLSYGPRKTLEIARALMSNPSVLLLDEPSSGLDHEEQAMLVSVLNEIRSSDRLTLIIVEHHMEVVRSLSTRVIALQAGEVLIDGSPDGVLDSDTFRKAVVGDVGTSGTADRVEETEG